jgi:hypothetical protein
MEELADDADGRRNDLAIAKTGAIHDHALDRNRFPKNVGLQRLGGEPQILLSLFTHHDFVGRSICPVGRHYRLLGDGGAWSGQPRPTRQVADDACPNRQGSERVWFRESNQLHLQSLARTSGVNSKLTEKQRPLTSVSDFEWAAASATGHRNNALPTAQEQQRLGKIAANQMRNARSAR